MRIRCKTTRLRCGSCGGQLHFIDVRWPFPRAHYVHASDHRYHCYGRRFIGPHTASQPLINDNRLEVASD